MAMKKKFLGLAMAAAIAIPASSAYAAPTITEIDKDNIKLETQEDSANYEIPVTGTVTDNKGQAPQKIEVELPSKMAFAVDQNGDVGQTTYKINNRSTNVDIELSVGAFTGGLDTSNGTGNGIQLVPESEMTSKRTDLFRNQVSLILANSDGTKQVDLGKYSQLSAEETKLGKIGAGKETILTLNGQGGKKVSTGEGLAEGTDVDSKGAEQEFNLVFSITKSPKAQG